MSLRTAMAAGVAVALGLTAAAAAIAVLAGSLGGQTGTHTTRPECPPLSSASSHHGPQGDNNAQPEPTRSPPTDVDTTAFGCAPVLADTNSGSDPGAPTPGNPGG